MASSKMVEGDPMAELIVRIIAFLAFLIFVFVSLRLIKPMSTGGKLARKLCIANAVGWLIILPLSTTGHPPPFLFPTILFWLVNLVLLPATASAVWVSYKERAERTLYLAVASTYVAMNAVVLFVVPLVWVMR
jgi:hypothetical protein